MNLRRKYQYLGETIQHRISTATPRRRGRRLYISAQARRVYLRSLSRKTAAAVQARSRRLIGLGDSTTSENCCSRRSTVKCGEGGRRR